MKKKLTLSVENDLIKTAKVKAVQYDCSVSELFENYIKAIEKNKQIIELIKDLNEKAAYPKSKKKNQGVVLKA